MSTSNNDARVWLHAQRIALTQTLIDIATSLAARNYTKRIIALAKPRLIELEKDSGLSVVSLLVPISTNHGWLTIPGPQHNLYEISALDGYRRIEFVPRSIPGEQILFLTTPAQEVTDQVRYPLPPLEFWTFYLKTLVVQTNRLPHPQEATATLARRLTKLCQHLLDHDTIQYL